MDKQRCALITGASRGVGRSVAFRLAQDGYDIVGCFRASNQGTEASEAAIRDLGVRCMFTPCDVSDCAAVDELVKKAEQEIGPITALINNAGIVRDNPMVLMPPEDWRAVLDTNLTGTWNVCRSVLFRFMKRRDGVVVNISSVAGIYGSATQTNYAATKAGIMGLSKSLAKEVASFGIRVNVVAPGFIETDMTAGLSNKLRERALAAIPLRRFGTTADVAEMVAYLVSDRAAYITGQVIQVDGGIAL